MVFMTMRHNTTSRMPIAEGRTVEIDFHIVCGQGVPAEYDMNEFFIDEPGQRLASSCVNNRRPSCQQHLAARFSFSESCSQLYEAFGDVADDTSVGTLGRDLGLHKAEYIAIPRPLKGDDPHTLATNHNLISLLHLRHRNSPGC